MIYIFSIVLLQVVMLTKLMDGANQSVVAEFVLLGTYQLLGDPATSLFVFSSHSCGKHDGKFLIILTVTCDPHLHSPMYLLLANLSFIDLWSFFSVTSQDDLWPFRKHKVISFRGCIAQIFFIHIVGGVEMMLLIAMAFDRYVAICKPLHYLTIMNPRMCISFLVAAW